MKSYKDYKLEDFLTDDDFQQWIRSGAPASVSQWQELLDKYPDKKPELEEARTWILFFQQQAYFTEADVEQGIQRVLASKSPQQNRRTTWLSSRWNRWQIAAALLLLIGIGWVVNRTLETDNPYTYAALTAQSPIVLNEIINTQAIDQRINLPDGSRIVLTPTSRVSYSTQMNKSPSREVFLTGEAFFEVTKNPSHPFLVYANGLVTRVIGTQFSVKTSPENGSVVVRSGRVAVYSMKNQQSAKQVVLTPNQQVTFQAKKNQLTPAISPEPGIIESDNQVISFQYHDTPVAKVFAQLEQTYGITIRYDSTTLKNCLLNVSLDGKPFFTKLDVVCLTIGATYKIQGTQILVSGPGCD